MRRREFLQAAVVGSVAVGSVTAAGRADAGSAAPYRPLGEVSVPGATEVATTAEAAFVADRSGFVVVDVADPRRPERVARVEDIGAAMEGGPLRDVWDLKLAGDRLFVAGPALQDIDALSGVAIYDVADPASPERTGFVRTDDAIHNCFVADDHLFVPESDTPKERLLVYDVAGDATRVGDWSLVDYDDRWATVFHSLYQLHDIWVDGDLAYLAHWDAGVVVLDVSDPSNPTFVSRFGGRTRELLQETTESGAEALTAEVVQPPGNVHALATDAGGDLLVVGREAWDLERGDDRGGAGAVDLYDVSDPTSPERLSRIGPPGARDQTRTGPFTTAHNFELVDGRLYTSWYHGGVKVHDVSDPENPEQVTWWQRPEAAKFWAARTLPGRDLFVGSNMGVEETYRDASLYVFPDEPTEDPPATDPAATPTPSPTPSPSPTPTRTAEPTPTTTASSPGFGPVAGLGALGVAAWRRLRD